MLIHGGKDLELQYEKERSQYKEGRRQYEKDRRQYKEHRLSNEEKIELYERRLQGYEAKCRFYDLGVLEFEHFSELVNEHRIDFPTITAEEIKDKSKGDLLSKTLAVVQTTWFIVQCGARGILGLAMTELELMTLALTAFWWNKPLGVQEPVKIYLKTLEERPVPWAEKKRHFNGQDCGGNQKLVVWYYLPRHLPDRL